MTRFETLEVWKNSRALCSEIYITFRDLKDFGFKDQITRSSLSIHSNIAEGFERGSKKETANFLNYAKGSAGELRSQIYTAIDIGYLDHSSGKKWLRDVNQISRQLHFLMKSVKKDQPGK